MNSWTIIGVLLTAVVAIANGMMSSLCFPEHVQAKFCNSDFVIRAKITSDVNYEIPKLPPTPSAQKHGTRGNGRGQGQNQTKKQLLKDDGPINLRGAAPAPRLRRSQAASSGIGGMNPRFPKYQEMKIKRILKGVGKVENTSGTTPEDKNTTTYTRYFSRVYIGIPKLKLKKDKAYLLAGKIIRNQLWVLSCGWYSEWESLTNDQLRGLKKDFILGCNECKVKTCFQAGCDDKNNQPGACMWEYRQDCKTKHSACRKINGKCQWKQNTSLAKCVKNQLP